MSAGTKSDRRAWNHFGDIARIGLVASATLLPRGQEGSGTRAHAGLCLLAINFAAKLLKKALPERRPDGKDDKSFPSEHAAQCVAAAMLIEREHPGKLGAIAYGTAAAVSLSRIEGGRHHPRDVIAGALLGVATVWVSLRIGGWIEQRKAQFN